MTSPKAADPAGTDYDLDPDRDRDPDLDWRLNCASARFFALLQADYEAREACRAFKDAARDLDLVEIVVVSAKRLCRKLPGASLEDAARAVANDLARILNVGGRT